VHSSSHDVCIWNLEPLEENGKQNSSNTNDNGKKNVGCELGKKMNKRFNLRRDGITRHSHENQRLQMKVRWSCSQGERKWHVVQMHERLDTTWKEKTRKTKETMGWHQAVCRTQLDWKDNRPTSVTEHERSLYPAVELWRLTMMMICSD